MLGELIALSAENTYAYIFIGQLPNSIQLGKDSPVQSNTYIKHEQVGKKLSSDGYKAIKWINESWLSHLFRLLAIQGSASLAAHPFCPVYASGGQPQLY